MKGANPRLKGFVFKPRRIFVESLEEIAQNLRRALQNLFALFYTGPDEPVEVLREASRRVPP